VNRVANRRTPARRGPDASSRTESEALVRFRKVLELELKRGCDDRAVIGGIDRFLENARADKDVRAVIEANEAPKPYASLDGEAREKWLRALIGAKSIAAKRPSTGSGRTELGTSSGRAGAKASVTAGPAARVDQPPDRPKDPLDQDVTVIKGVKGATQGKLAKLGLATVRDLLYLFPNRHNDFADVRPISELVPDEDQTALVTVWSASIVRLGRRPGTQAVVGDESGTMRVVWFNQPYLADQLHTNDRIVIAGKVGVFNRNKTMENPEWERVGSEDLTHTGRLVPVYPLTQGLSQRVLRRVVKEAVDRFAEALKEPLPKDLRGPHAPHAQTRGHDAL
jgi:ATP-dependent DNA helicase RecG